MRNYKWQVSGLLVASIAATLFSISAVAAINYSFTGSSGQTVTGSSFSAAGGGWRLISHLSDVSNVSSNSASITGSASFNTGASPVFSSYWLVGAYNPIVGSSPGWTRDNDFVKISGLTGSTKPTGGGQVPEPTTLLLMGAGLLGMTYVRRREAPVKSGGKADNTLSC